ncbi:nrps [Venturia inaequalis]|uniref:Nrps n=1 Tax=Venturia inaequalis TaxID=5025 RepID=A0A8H3YYH0_VENIN|nr:nrps [Venturia inaequalis]
MDLSQLKKIRAAGKLEEMAAVAHELNLYTTAGYSVHYKPSQAITELEPLIYQALAQVLRENPILFAVPIVPKHEECYFARLPSIDLRKVTSFVERRGPVPEDGKGRDLELDALLQQQVNTNYKSQDGITPVWRLIILYNFPDRQQFTANFMAHHGIADGASFQILHRSFQKALQALSSTSAAKSEVEYIIQSKDEEIGPPLESIHSMLIPDAAPGGETATYNDWLGNPTEVPSRTGYATLTLPSPLVQLFTQECKKNKVAPPAGLNALIAKVLYSNLPSTTESMDANIPVDIRSDIPPGAVDGVMGNFFDAFKTRIFRADFCEKGSSELTDIWTPAKKISKDTRKYFSNTAPTGEAYLNIAGLKNIPDLQALLTSLIGGQRTESLELAYIGPHVPFSGDRSGITWQAGKTTVSRCAFAAGACLQATVVLHDEGMTIGFAWPVCAVEENLIENTIDGIRAYFVALEERSK